MDTHPEHWGSTGVGRYGSQLRRALEALPDVVVSPVTFTRRRPASPLSRLTQGLFREGVYYPIDLARRVRAADVDVLHCPAAFAPVLADRPVVLTIHDLLPIRFPEMFPRRMVVHDKRLLPRRARRAARIVTGSHHSRAEIIECLGVAEERVIVTPYGVDGRFQRSAPAEGWLRERFGLDGDFGLCVGTMEPRRNLQAAARAFGAATAGLRDRSLVVVGSSGWMNEAFEQAVAESRLRVIVTGRVTDEELVWLYSSARCFITPSLHEGFGFPALEAMACGAPVISSNRTSLPEVVGDAGILVDPDDLDAFAAAIKSVFEDDRLAEELGRRGLERSRGFTWETTAAATAEVYRDALRETKP